MKRSTSASGYMPASFSLLVSSANRSEYSKITKSVRKNYYLISHKNRTALLFEEINYHI